MAGLKLNHIYKVYDNGHKAVNDFSIDIKDKEFIVFVGPSGCGKSTTLRMIAGLEQITAGDLFIGDTLVNDVEPKDRDIAMVFQSYALYPHMTVFENMAFGLRNRHYPKEVIKQKVLEAAKMLDIEDYLDRKPKAMSGGQRQRVALGRALVRDPKVFLLDEPLSNLDAKLRAQMRTEITKLHKKLATTFIYVTHDQVEAMTMGTRIVVMKLGYVQQIDTPMNLYNEPYNKFVAGFIGTPQMNFFNVTLLREKDVVEVRFEDGSSLKLPYESVSKIHRDYLKGEKKVIFGIRPEHLEVSNKETGLSCHVTAVEHLGNECIIYGQTSVKDDEFTMKDEGKNIIIKVTEGLKVEVGDVVHVKVNEDKVHFFDGESEVTLMEKIPSYSNTVAKVSGGNLELLGSKVKLLDVFKEAIGKEKEFNVEIPPYAIVPGSDYKLKVKKVEKVDGKYLAYLADGDHYLFALVGRDVKEGQSYSFDLLNDKLKLMKDNKVLLEPIGEEESLIGRFVKEEKREKVELPEEEMNELLTKKAELTAELEKEDADKKALKQQLKEINFQIKMGNSVQRVFHFFALINEHKIELPVANGYKMNSVEGNDCYKNEYRYVTNRKNIHLAKEGLDAKVNKVLDYGNVSYAEVSVDEQKLLVLVDKDFKGESLKLDIKGKDLSVWSTDIDMMIF